jgi:hypothetical protein
MPATIDEVIDALLDNADFEAENSVAKARAFITAANRFLIMTPASQSDKGSSLSMGLAEIRNLLTAARSFVNQADTNSASTSRVRFLSAKTGWRR